MFSVAQDAVPDESLLRTYPGGARPECWRGQGDCFAVSVDRVVTLAEFVFAFYTSPVFWIERLILGLLAGAPSSRGAPVSGWIRHIVRYLACRRAHGDVDEQRSVAFS